MSHPTVPHGGRSRLFWLTVALALGAPVGASAQSFDSPLVAPGRVRFEVLPAITSFDSRFGVRPVGGSVVEESEPLGFDFSAESVGVDLFPELADAQTLIADALEDDAFSLSLGSARLLMDATSTRVPFRVDVGIFDWLTVGAMLPVVKRRIEVGYRMAGSTANVGVSPVITDPGAPSTFLNDLVFNIGQVDVQVAEICSTMGEEAPECVGARDFVNEMNVFTETLRAAYAGSEFFPLEGSSAGDALTQRIRDFQTRMQSFGVSDFDALPPLAESAMSASEYRSRFLDPVYGGGAGLPAEGGETLWQLGDMELTAAARLLHHEVVDTADGGPSFRARVVIGGTLRLPTATEDTLRSFLDLDAYRGQTDVEVRLFTDATWFDKHVGARLDVRYGLQRSKDVLRRIAAPGDVYRQAPAGTLTWTPGNYLSAEISPRVLLTPELAVGAVYSLYDRSADEYELLSLPPEVEPDSVDVSVLAQETEATVQRVGFHMTFSSVEAYQEGRTGLPFEILARWETAVSGSGGRTPEDSRFVAGVRIYYDLWDR